MSETYPHVRGPMSTASVSFCRCGKDDSGDRNFRYDRYTPPSESWGSDCPIALREALADVTKERDAARLEARAYGNALARQQADDERIRRVKAIREETGCGLSEALAIVNGNTELAVKLHRTLVEERDELHAELANECGEGPPPSEGWRYRACEWIRPGAIVSFVLATTIDGMVRRRWEWAAGDKAGQRTTARAAMRAADAALTGAKP